MRVLITSHNYPPGHRAGTELYAAALARGLRARGHAVHVLTADKDVSRPHLSVREREHEGVPVTELVNNLFHDDFRRTWDEPAAARAMGEVLDRFRPDLVAAQHLLYLSVGCVEEAAQRGVPVALTLHDFWLQCARFGQRLDWSGALCEEIDLDRCARCVARLDWRQSGLARRVGGVLSSVRAATGLDLAAAARRASRLVGGGGGGPAEPGAEELAATRAALEERARGVRQRLFPAVDLFLSPSRFLLDELVRWGLPADRARVVRTGVDRARFAGERAPRGAEVRVAFLGSLLPKKGAHVLLEAWGRLAPARRAKGRLDLFGPALHEPEYVARLRARAAEVGATLHPPLAPEEVPARLLATDLLVVPSLWYENAPLVILEAMAARTPLLVSDLGGMAELVREGESGARFPAGDADALAARMGDLLDAPARLDALYAGDAPVRSAEEQLDETLALFDELLARGRSG